MVASGLVPMIGLGASWQIKDNSDFAASGYHTNGVVVQSAQLRLAYQNVSLFQKVWTGGSGQAVLTDSTRFLSKNNLDTSGQDGIKLEKESWTRLKDAPTARKEQVAVYDPAGQQMFMFGGQNATGSMSTTWAYKPSTDSWTPLADAPISRYWHSGSWDPVHQVLLIHGGFTDSGTTKKFNNDTWIYDPTANAWSRKANETAKRFGQSSAWDPIHQRHIVYGGQSDTGVTNDTMAYEPIGDNWEKKAKGPAQVMEETTVWATGLDRMLVFGGMKPAGVTSRELYSYDPEANKWTGLALGSTEVIGHAAAWNPVTKEMVVVGGHVSSMKYNNTWIYNSIDNSWRDGKPIPAAARSGHTLVWVPEKNVFILYGGESDAGLLSEIWAYSPYYVNSGDLVSSSFDTSSTTMLTNVSWTEARSPSGCTGASVRLQLAGSMTLDGSSYMFAGPEGTTSYYTNGQTVGHDLFGMKYVRYKAYLSTSDVACTAVLKEVRIGAKSYLPTGNWTSGPFDTGSNSLDLISSNFTYDTPSGTTAKVYLRSAYTADMMGASDWEMLTAMDSGFRTPARRYLQLMAQLNTEKLGVTPSIGSVSLFYNSLPKLITSPVSPSTGGSSTEFVYKVIYIDADGETPATYKVFIDDRAHDMQPQTYDYKGGANFTFATKLASGQHTYRFDFSDGHNRTLEPAMGDFKGPVVNDPPKALLKAPTGATKDKKVTFDASGSLDPEGKLKQYKFNFGDGTDSGWINASKTTHAYKKTGTFKANVTVKDALDAQATSTDITIKVTETKGFIPAPGPVAIVAAVMVSALVARAWRRNRGYR
jgi:N-acetylneuraminic acid mutarotase